MSKFNLTDFRSALPRPAILIAWLVLIGILVWSYAAVMGRLIVDYWWGQPDYGHGFVVPVFALVLLWVRREMIRPLPDRGSWWGIAFFGVWALMRWVAAYISVHRVDEVSLLVFLAGVAVFVGGWRALRWAWPSIVFLIFMVPLPGFAQSTGRHFLQRLGTELSVRVIRTLGIPAAPTGAASNVIQLPERQLGVEEACSGLRMLMLFFAISVGVAFLLRGPLWKKIVVVLSAAPIAVLANVARITLTAVLYHLAGSGASAAGATLEQWAEWLFHGGAGLLMMPFALVLLWGLLAVLDRLFLEAVPAGPLALGRSPPGESGRGGSQAANNLPKKS